MLIRGAFVVTNSDSGPTILQDGAVVIRDGRIIDIGTAAVMAAQYPGLQNIGSKNHMVIPGLINAHDHGRGITAFQLGVRDHLLEVWLLDLFDMLHLDPYLTAAYAHVMSIESGVTTMVNNYYHPIRYSYVSDLQRMIQASEDTGLRSVFALGFMDRSPVNRLIKRVSPLLPDEFKAKAKETLDNRGSFIEDDFFSILKDMRDKLDRSSSCVTALISPVSVHWCSDGLLARIRDFSDANACPIHTHMLETRFQRDDALREHGKTIVEHLKDIGFLSPRLACAHCVWVSPSDIEILASHGVSVIHNPSSNLRLSSGLAPVNAMSRAGVNLALGIDSNSLNDDNDMFQEMRLAINLQRSTGEWAAIGSIGSEQVLSMATRDAARTIGMGDTIGALEIGMAADVVLLRYDKISYPFVSSGQNSLDTLVQRARVDHVDSVIVNGKLVMKEGRILTIDKAALVKEIQTQLKKEDNKQKSLPETWVKKIRPYILDYFIQQGDRLANRAEKRCTK